MNVDILSSAYTKYLFLVVVYTALLLAEVRWPAVPPRGDRWQHTLDNLRLGALYSTIGILIGILLTWLAVWTSEANIGLFNAFALPLWAQIFLGIIALDFVEYWRHRFSHEWPWVWRVHRVHHSDPLMEASTAIRNHPLNWLTIYVPRAMAIPLLGIAPITLAIHIPIWITLAYFHHANIRLPERLDRVIGSLFVTPSHHYVHHSRIQKYTDSQYGVLFIFWDKLFGTLVTAPEREAFAQGLDEFDNEADQTVHAMLFVQPFKNVPSSLVTNSPK
jgi:sterol desaturase/sphingolipid hydroxylase (fatty acid hydroxylase superfamily)